MTGSEIGMTAGHAGRCVTRAGALRGCRLVRRRRQAAGLSRIHMPTWTGAPANGPAGRMTSNSYDRDRVH